MDQNGLMFLKNEQTSKPELRDKFEKYPLMSLHLEIEQACF